MSSKQPNPTTKTPSACWSKVAPDHPAFASCLMHFARLLETQGLYAAAEKLLRQALAITPDEETADALSALLRREGLYVPNHVIR